MCQRKSRKGSRGMGEENTEGEEKVQGWHWEAECKGGKSRGGLGHEIGHYLIHRVFLGRFCRKPCACRRELDGEPEGNQDLLALLVWIVATTSRPIHQPQFGDTQTGEPLSVRLLVYLSLPVTTCRKASLDDEHPLPLIPCPSKQARTTPFRQTPYLLCSRQSRWPNAPLGNLLN